MTTLLASPDTTDKALELLNLPSRDRARRVGDNYATQHNIWYYRLWRALHSFLHVVDPFDNITHHARLTRSEFKRLMDEQSTERREENGSAPPTCSMSWLWQVPRTCPKSTEPTGRETSLWMAR